MNTPNSQYYDHGSGVEVFYHTQQIDGPAFIVVERIDSDQKTFTTRSAWDAWAEAQNILNEPDGPLLKWDGYGELVQKEFSQPIE